jgi:hypothetical protein
MNARQQRVIDFAMSFPMAEVVKRYAKDYQADLAYAERLERELKRYLILCALDLDKGYAMAGPVDGLWHTFLLFTRLYASFCEQTAGKFLHHEPGDIENEAELETFERDYANLWHDYERTFGEPPPDIIWPTFAKLCNQSSEAPAHGVTP